MLREKIELAFSLLVTLILIWVLWEGRHWPFHSRLFPWSIGFIALFIAVLQVTSSISRLRMSPAEDAKVHDAAGSRDLAKRTLTMIGWVVTFFLGLWLLGFYFGSLVLTFAFLKLGAREGWVMSAVLSFAIYMFFVLVFDFALSMPLYSGVLIAALGLPFIGL